MKSQARRELETWIDLELGWYVKDYISDSDYKYLRKHLIDIAAAHAANVSRKQRKRRSQP
jgi:hypothetical protein